MIRYSLLLSLLIVSVILQGQNIYGNCSYSTYVGTTCQYTISPPNGDDVLFYSLTGFPQAASSSRDIAANTKTYTTTWSSSGSYTLHLRENGGPSLAQITVNVYYGVGQVSLSGPSGSICQSVGSSGYTASATNASTYNWSLSPASAGSISTMGAVTWNTSFTGVATVSVSAYGTLGEYTSTSLNITRLANQTFSASINAPSVVCEGESFTIGVQTSHSSATYAWYERENNTLLGTTAYLPVRPEPQSHYRVVVTPGSGIDCLINPQVLTLETTASSFHVRPRVTDVFLTNPETGNSSIIARCSNNVSPTTLNAASEGKSDSYQWIISPETAGQLSASDYTESGQLKSVCQVNWNSSFIGTATITVTAFGCGSSQASQSTNPVRVTKLPAAYTLSGLPQEMCANATMTAALTGSEANVTYTLSTSAGDIPRLTATSWTIGPGTYTVSAVDNYGDCPAVTSPSQRIENRRPQTSFSAGATGSVFENASGKVTLRACEDSNVQIAALGANHNYEWYRVYDNSQACRLKGDPRYWAPYHNNPEVLDQKWKDKCLRPITSNGNTTSFEMGFFDQVYMRYVDDACNIGYDEKIYLEGIPATRFEGILPDIFSRQQGPGTTQFEVKYSGPLYGLQWEITPSQAGTISPNGLVTWNELWSSFSTPVQQSAIVKANLRMCTGIWESFPKSILVFPILDFDENRVRTFIPQQAIPNYADVINQIGLPNVVNVKAGYFDGLGRNVQNVQYFGATSAKDIIELKMYDEFGREAVKNLPYSATHSSNYRNQSIVEHVNFYNNPPVRIQGDVAPFAKTIFEASPLNRVIEQGAPGADWQPGTGNTIKKSYEVSGVNDVYLFTYDVMSGNITWTNNAAGYYAQNQLTANKTIDEHGNDIVEYADKEGRTVCKKVKAPDGVYAWTYYVYDDLGNLVVVLSPEAVKTITGQ